MQFLRTFVPLLISLLTFAVAQEGSGLPFITAAPPTAGSIEGVVATTETLKSITAPISQGDASSAIILSGTRTTSGQSSATGASADGSQSSNALVFDTTPPSHSSATTAAAGTTVTRTTTGSATAAGNVAPTTGLGAWQSWLAVMAGGLFVAAGLV